MFMIVEYSDWCLFIPSVCLSKPVKLQVFYNVPKTRHKKEFMQIWESVQA